MKSDSYEGTPYERCHQILGHALRAAEETDRPSPPFHLGGPSPKCSSTAYLGIGRWSADVVYGQVPEEHLALYGSLCAVVDELLALPEAERVAQWGTLSEEHPRHDIRQRLLDGARLSRRGLPNPVPIASMLCVAADNVIDRHGDRAQDSIKAISARVVRCLTAEVDGEAVGEYLRALDRRLVFHECQEAVDRYAKGKPTTVAEVLFRADRGNGTAGHFICRLDASDGGGEFGLVTKIKNRFRWFRGTREEILATLPDGVFAEGVEAVLG